jgi:hypothetical protein
MQAVSFCHQMATWVSDMFCNFYLMKSYKRSNDSTTIEPREKISADLEFLESYNFVLTEFKNNQILLKKISH